MTDLKTRITKYLAEMAGNIPTQDTLVVTTVDDIAAFVRLEVEAAQRQQRMFPVLRAKGGCPTLVPWDFIAPHERWAMNNHSQTLERLAERGGITAGEMVAVIEGRRWTPMEYEKATARLEELLAEWATVEKLDADYKAAAGT